MTYDVSEVKFVGEHILELQFEDGTRGRVDLGGYAAKGGVFSRFADGEYFRQAYLNEELGTVCWPDGLDIAPETLYFLARGVKAP